MQQANKEMNLSIRERKMLKGIVNGLRPSEAARQAGYAESTIKAHLNQILGKPRVIEAINKILDDQGLSDEKLIEVLAKGIDATEFHYATLEGKITDTMESPDWRTRYKFLDTALKLKGIYPLKKKEVNHGVNVQTVFKEATQSHYDGEEK